MLPWNVECGSCIQLLTSVPVGNYVDIVTLDLSVLLSASIVLYSSVVDYSDFFDSTRYHF